MKELEKEGIGFDPDVRIGVMIETPSAAMTADKLAQEVDFFSIGTNDLVQYTLGVDRENELVAHLYDPSHVAVLKLIQMTVEKAHKAGIEVGVCGEIASEPMYVPILVALECNFLSMRANAIPQAKQIIRDLTMTEARDWLAEILDLDTPKEIRSRLSARYSGRFRALPA
jgi:phosphotransferase system enzyme I (PtsI)